MNNCVKNHNECQLQNKFDAYNNPTITENLPLKNGELFAHADIRACNFIQLNLHKF